MTLVCGVNERDGSVSRGTLYNTVVVIGSDGNILNRHRKLMPTHEERLVWAPGDGHGLRVHDLEGFRVGGGSPNWQKYPANTFNHIPGGSIVLYFDGHVEFRFGSAFAEHFECRSIVRFNFVGGEETAYEFCRLATD